MQSLSIAGTNTILRNVTNYHSMNNNYHHNINNNHLYQLSHRNFAVNKQQQKGQKKQSSPSSDWDKEQKKYIRGIEYDTDKKLNEVFREYIIDSSTPNRKTKKRFNFEYEEFLRQKYKTPQNIHHHHHHQQILKNLNQHQMHFDHLCPK